MKKVVILGLAVLLLAGCNEAKNNEESKDDKPVENVYILEYGDYKNIKLENIISVSVVRYTVGGDIREEITDKDEISQLYNSLKSTKVGEEVEMACEDNTTIYNFNMSDGNKYSIEIECQWFVIKGKHYSIVN